MQKPFKETPIDKSQDRISTKYAIQMYRINLKHKKKLFCFRKIDAFSGRFLFHLLICVLIDLRPRKIGKL